MKMSIVDPENYGDLTALIKLLNQIDIPWNLVHPIQDEIDEIYDIIQNAEEAEEDAKEYADSLEERANRVHE
jgi:hypothetical protein